ncbi:T9SS type A sorting domain-containing protein [candidate division WOR-3 bacterium]|nr:T9SS type A sorting domain-containing protein [candidate division WOR-3 bacterium]
MQFYITFAPTNPGAETGNIIFTHNADTSPDSVTVTGTGVGGEAPEILSVLDIPDDQGRWVRVTWAASLFDQPGSVMPITQYGVWRRIDEDDHDRRYSGAATHDRNCVVFAGYESVLEGWDCVGAVPAIQDSVYNFVSPTLGDSNAYGIYYSVFMVTAHTQDPYVWFASEPDSGYSIDNIPPEPPYDLAAEVINSDVLLTWQIEVNYTDFSHFAVYRDTVSGFTPGAANQIGTSEVSSYTDSSLAIGSYYYRVSALDINGNESGYSNEVEAVITGIVEAGIDMPTSYALFQNHPNPFRVETGIRYQLPRPDFVTIAIYNVSGQRIKTLVNEHTDAGYYAIRWDGRNESSQTVSNGVYFCRMKAGEYTSVKKILLTR